MIETEKQYQAVETFVRSRAGQRLPGERELTAEFEISRPRLRNILERLRQEGLVQRRQGSGTYSIAPSENGLHRVALLIDSALKLGDDPFFSLLVELLQEKLQSAKAECLIQRTTGADVNLPTCDGVIGLGLAGLDSLHHPALDSRPAVGLFGASDARAGDRRSMLKLEDENAGLQAARRLLDAGVENAYFFGRTDITAVRERLIGVEKEFRNTEVPLHVIECGLNFTAGLEQGARFDSQERSIIGIISANDWLAMGLHTGIQSQSPEVRQRVKLVAFDGLPAARQPELGIDSLVAPLDAIALDAVAELLRLKRTGAMGRTIYYPLSWDGEVG